MGPPPGIMTKQVLLTLALLTIVIGYKKAWAVASPHPSPSSHSFSHRSSSRTKSSATSSPSPSSSAASSSLRVSTARSTRSASSSLKASISQVSTTTTTTTTPVRTSPSGIAVIQKQGVFDVSVNVKVPDPRATVSNIGQSKTPQGKESFHPPSQAASHAAPLPPTVVPTTIDPPEPTLAWGFDGMNNFDQTECGNGDYYLGQTSVEPSDVSICVGKGKVVQLVNSAFLVYDVNGSRLMPPIPLAQFFLLPPGRSYVTEAKCMYDMDTESFIIAGVGQVDQDMHLALSVSDTDDPMERHHIYALPTRGDGNVEGWPAIEGCPCVIHDPFVGADRFGLFVTVDHYTNDKAHAFVGAQIYALGKDRFVSAPTSIDVTFFTNVHVNDRSRASGLRPANAPAPLPKTTRYSTTGVHYFLSSAASGKVAVWALLNTLSLADRTLRAGMQLMNVLVDTAPFLQPPYADQKDGDRPLGALAQGNREGAAQLEVLDSGDTRLTKTTFADGKLWTAVATAVAYDLPIPTSKEDEWRDKVRTRAGFLWLCIHPNLTSDYAGGPLFLSPTVINQGYIAVLGENVIVPALAVNEEGRGAATFTLVGPHYFPSVGYVPISSRGAGKVHIISSGIEPHDGFSGYLTAGGSEDGVARWGDSSGSTVDEQGNVWLACQYSPGTIRTIATNWGTYILRIKPPFFT
ncbi:hypothetical protein CBR_g44277 [Chara braunii]|uniref:Uncharacterized protein n=1 Tax=Chara braunii TaxID=69332 RepID=A0A388K368_CHABU|nr:hypothetical protein CBR_g44277 [Chara braunii]|eukprot:GBG64393.1 hypothetical protein CBR_g44277 [Chara braunii]